MWQKSVYDFSIDVSGDQFISGTLVDIVSSARLPGVVLGDINDIHSSSKDFDGCPSLTENEKFDDVLLEADLVEFSVTSNWFTWTSKLQGNGILCRLDRFLSNEAWKKAFPYLEAEGFIDTIRSMWRKSEDVSPMVSIVRNLKAVKRVFRASFGRRISMLADEVRATSKVMEATQAEVERDPASESVCAEETQATEVFWLVARLEEASLRQKAKFSWSEEGVEALGRPVSREEIQKALFSMKSGKAPEPDGTPLQFVSLVSACVTLPKFFVMINGSLEGFFPGRKGLRFHDRYEHLGLTHLVFADDLMIFCAAERDSLEFVRQVLVDFVRLFGLVINVGKSSIFVTGMESGEAEELAASMGFSLGSLLIRYLGLPLLAGWLRVVDCAPMIQRITTCIRSWAVRSLFFTGRLQLVRSVS
ncbi:uncharacterized protein LOC120090641 [Benincasa hispida]|uniref:uncharacterized protein LOC120090641 n=1 Tax=Benincasa hispida TaxID=102211 RepID=UPI0019013325|nr:uncharacterized protein LOC120090641 [Benincasa hispida]